MSALAEEAKARDVAHELDAIVHATLHSSLHYHHSQLLYLSGDPTLGRDRPLCSGDRPLFEGLSVDSRSNLGGDPYPRESDLFPVPHIVPEPPTSRPNFGGDPYP